MRNKNIIRRRGFLALMAPSQPIAHRWLKKSLYHLWPVKTANGRGYQWHDSWDVPVSEIYPLAREAEMNFGDWTVDDEQILNWKDIPPSLVGDLGPQLVIPKGTTLIVENGLPETIAKAIDKTRRYCGTDNDFDGLVLGEVRKSS